MRKVYIIADHDHGLYKIGVTKNIERRLKQLQTGNGTVLETLHVFETHYAGAIEKMLHRKYSHLCTSGEWFKLNQEILDEFPLQCKELENICKIMQDNPFNTLKPDKWL